jgi:ubiquinone/menaquinone biosynthesis C-methylase UbiE
MPYLFIGGVLAVAGAFGWLVCHRRTRMRVQGIEGMDDRQVVDAFVRVSRILPWRLMRRMIVKRAAAMVNAGEAADLGCGPGYLAAALAKGIPALHVTGVDLSEDMLVLAQAEARRSGVESRVSFRFGDVRQLPFEDSSLDFVVSTLSLHHWRDPIVVMDEIERVIVPGGSFLIFDFRRDMVLPFYFLLWIITHFMAPRALRRIREPLSSRDAAYTPHEATQMATRSRLSGWRIVAGKVWLWIEGTKI